MYRLKLFCPALDPSPLLPLYSRRTNQRIMDIIWHGNATFTLKGQTGALVTDPFEGVGVQIPDLKGKVLAIGDPLGAEKGKLPDMKDSAKILDWPGEFEVSGISVECFDASRHDGGNALVFTFLIDGIRVCHLGGLNKVPNDAFIQAIGDVDVLLVPVGGNGVLDAKAAFDMVEAIEPRTVVPMYYAMGENPLGLGGVEEFLKLVGQMSLKPVDKLSMKGRSVLPEGTMEYVLLSC